MMFNSVNEERKIRNAGGADLKFILGLRVIFIFCFKIRLTAIYDERLVLGVHLLRREGTNFV